MSAKPVSKQGGGQTDPKLAQPEQTEPADTEYERREANATTVNMMLLCQLTSGY